MQKICLSHFLIQNVVSICTMGKAETFPIRLYKNHLLITETKVNVTKDFVH